MDRPSASPPPLLEGEHIPEPHAGPAGWIGSRTIRALLLGAAGLTAVGLGVSALRAQRGCHCQVRKLSVAEREARLAQELRSYEHQVQSGHGCRMRWVQLKLDHLRAQEALTQCGRARARLRGQIQQLEQLQVDMREQGVPAGHPYPDEGE